MSTRSSVRALRALARAYGVQRRYRGADRVDHTVSDDTLGAVLRLLGAELHTLDDAPEGLRAYEAARARDVVEPVLVQWGAQPLSFDVRVPTSVGDRSLRVSLRREDGDDVGPDQPMPADALVVHPGVTAGMRRITLAPLPFGPYRLHVDTGSRQGDAVVLAVPKRLAPAGRQWGVFAPTYALHDCDRASTGTLATLDRFARWSGDHGASVVGTLPLLATFFGAGREPHDASPYAPVSRKYWNEVYLDLAAVPEVEAGVSIAEPSPGEFVDLPALAARKRAVLEAAASRVAAQPARAAAFARFLATRPDIVSYATFRAAVELEGPGASLHVENDHPIVRYHAYAQWLMEEQFEELRRRFGARGQDLYLDLPIGSHAHGYDVATNRPLFALGAAVGAPPDSFFRDGQNWGFPPVHPHEARRDGHRYLRACVDAHFRVARRVRVDHVLGFHRLWWVPDGASSIDGAYVRYPAEELYAVLALAAYRSDGDVVGENLGTVPPETNRALRRHGMLGMYVVPFEADAERDPPLTTPTASTLACLDTHDTATFAVWWRGLPAEDRDALVAMLQRGAHLRENDLGEPDDEAVLAAMLAFLGASRAGVVLANVEDLWLETVPQNIPGTTNDERPNFRRRLARSLDELEQLAESAPERATLAQLDRSRRARGGRV